MWPVLPVLPVLPVCGGIRSEIVHSTRMVSSERSRMEAEWAVKRW